MAPIPGSIQINFTSNYSAGQHRVCYRYPGSPGYPLYDCSLIVNCTPFVLPITSVACQANIPITVDNESCEEILFDGYIQPTCEDVLSLVGRVAFSTTFTPNPSCIAVDFTCNNVGILDVPTVVPLGTGYTNGVGYTVNPLDIVGGGGTGTVITFDVIANSVTNLVVTVPGTGYISTPSITITTLSGAGGNDDAVLTVEMENCPTFALTDTCDNADAGIIIDTLLGSTFSVCYTGGVAGAPVPPTNFNAVDNVALCCYDCVTLTINPPISAITATTMYLDCGTGAVTTVTRTNVQGSLSVCAKRGSWASDSVETIFVEGVVCLPS